ncbi:MAG: single-stranded DNA-binding protein [Endomicrobiia bacterium]|nr:single-stranded DNA-binding protein [Endomicrobiaceae bacterium]MDD3053783.1 single-stranded DNA-binding protein [Endomicrobiaceae bacterium]MDD3922788.1 single-stranded DNA-binding protein [Endomicrobiaceae bacterium]
MNQPNYQLPQQNSVILVGRLTRDPELKRTSTAKSVCRFDIAISRRFKDAATGEWKDSDPTYVPTIVWGDQAERCADKLKKGMPVHVEGRLQTSSWQAADGTKKSRLEVVASRVQFLVRIEQQVSKVSNVNNEAGNEYVSDNDVAIDDEEVPF